MTTWAVPIDEVRETIEGHVFCMLENSEWEEGDEYPDCPSAEDYPDAFGSWCFVAGYANALGLTSEQLLVELEIDIQSCGGICVGTTRKGRQEANKK